MPTRMYGRVPPAHHRVNAAAAANPNRVVDLAQSLKEPFIFDYM